jgi:hypothetical protein
VLNPLLRAITLALTLAAVCLFPLAGSAAASRQQLSMFEEDAQLQHDPVGTLNTLRGLGVGIVRVYVAWSSIAPAPNARGRPAHFNAASPAAYAASRWAVYDEIVRAAARRGIAVDLTLSAPAPRWATGAGAPRDAPRGVWKPSAREYGQFVRAVATRYSGRYVPARSRQPLPAVRYWAIWNEPNFGKDFGPQAIRGSSILYSPVIYRSLVDAAWSAFQSLPDHAKNTILIGSLAARGASSGPRRGAPQGFPGNFATAKPLQFIRTLYCVDSRYRRLRGLVAALTNCPTTAAGSRRFRAAHPALFAAGGFADHPYPINRPPTRATSNDPDYTEFSQIPRLVAVLDRLQRGYGSRKRFPVYITEYGYITNPPNRSNHFVSSATAAVYDNWSEYLSWRSPRIATTMQYLLVDPNPSVGVPEFGGFASGLSYFGGRAKPIGGGRSMLDSYRMPLFMPSTSARRGRSLEVWGAVRPAHYLKSDTGRPQSARIELQPRSRGSFVVVATVPITDPRGYFDKRVRFSSGGTVRLAWQSAPRAPVRFSRLQKITVR